MFILQQFNPEHKFTKLVPDLTGVDPDDAFSSKIYFPTGLNQNVQNYSLSPREICIKNVSY